MIYSYFRARELTVKIQSKYFFPGEREHHIRVDQVFFWLLRRRKNALHSLNKITIHLNRQHIHFKYSYFRREMFKVNRKPTLGYIFSLEQLHYKCTRPQLHSSRFEQITQKKRKRINYFMEPFGIFCEYKLNKKNFNKKEYLKKQIKVKNKQ